MPQVSIVLPCYNAARTLTETLDSIFAQTFADFEVIAVDDGSEDETLSILERRAGVEPRLRVLPLVHGGVIPAANGGMMVAEGHYIARMDADDLMYPERITQQVALLDEKPDIDIASCLVRGVGEVREGFRIYLEWLNGLVMHEQIANEMFVESVIPNPSVMFRRELLDQVGMLEEHGWPEDYDFWLRAYLAGARFEKVPQVLHDWREHEARLTRTDSRYSVENFIRAKAHYIMQGPVKGRDAVILWGAGMMGRRFSKHLLREGGPLVVFIDIDPKKVGRTRRDKPIISPGELMDWWGRYENPVVLAAVGARGARQLIREQLTGMGLIEGADWFGVA